LSQRLRNDIANANRIAIGPQGVDASQDVNMGPYLDMLRKKVAEQWHPELSNSSAQTTIAFSISRTGEVNQVYILQTSGSTVTDKAALKAVQRAAPFEPLPEDFPESQLHIQFRFNINIYKE
jgi:TonB family protein